MRHSQLTDDLQEQASLYAAGAMPESERAEYQRHLEDDQCAVCRTELSELQAAMSMLALSVDEATPSSSVRDRLMEQAGKSPLPSRPAPSFFRRYWYSMAASAAAIVLLVTLLASTRTNEELRRLADTLASRIAELEAQISQQRTYLVNLTSPETRVIDLTGTGASAAARARIFWNTGQRTWRVYVQDLPPATSDKQYQLWFIPKSGDPVSAAAFNTRTDGSVELEIELQSGLTDLKQAAVTTEPIPEKTQPTGPVGLASPAE